MEVGGLADVDWTAAWYAPLAETGRRVAAAADWRAELNRCAVAADVRTARGRPVVFAGPQAAGAAPYEAHIAATGAVSTRANLHDLFNALIWLTLPRFKARLNELQAAAIERDGIGARRSALRDAATLLDENAVLLVSDDHELVEQLRRHEWQAALVGARTAWDASTGLHASTALQARTGLHARIRPLACGHALLEKLVRPYKAITAHGWHVPLPAAAEPATIDAWLADAIAPQLSARDLLPVPVLGIPGWWPDNADPRFYADAAVFRPRRDAHNADLRTRHTRQ